jgi:ATP-binding protein involved in chromosome partitioning
VPVLGVVENMSGFICPCCDHFESIFGGETNNVENFCTERNCEFLGRIPINVDLGEGADVGKLPMDNEVMGKIVENLKKQIKVDEW